MGNRLRLGFAGFLALFLLITMGCAVPQPATRVTEPDVPPPVTYSPEQAIIGVAAGVTDKVRGGREAKASEAKTAAGTITIDCSVKLPDDPTDNPELCRSFQMEIVEAGGVEVDRFRFGTDARYRFSGKAGKKYQIHPRIGKNWEFTVEPNRDVVIGERVRVQLRQKQ